MDTQPVSPALTALVRTLVQAIGRRSLADILTVVQDADLTVPQLAALSVVKRAGALTLTALSEPLGLSLSHTSYLTEQLVKRGLLSRAEDPANRRQKIIALTAEGTALTDQLTQVRRQGIEETLERVPADIRQRLEAVLADLVPHLQPTIPS